MADRRGGQLTLFLLTGVYAINYLDRQILAILVEPIKAALGLSDTQVGLLFGAPFALLYATISIPIASYADRADRAKLVTMALILFSIMSAACGSAVVYWQLLAARSAVAIFEAGTNAPSHSLISDTFPFNRRSTAMAVFSLGPHIGVILSFLIGGWLVQYWGWRTAFVSTGVLGLSFAVFTTVWLRDPGRKQYAPTHSRAALIQALKSIFANRTLRHLIAGGTIYSIAAYSLIGWLPALLIRTGKMSPFAVGTILALVIGLIGAFGTLFGGLAADRFGKSSATWRLRLVGIVLLLMSPFWATGLLTPDPALMMGFMFLPCTLLGFFSGPTFAMTQSLVDPSIRATAAAIMLFFFTVIGLGMGPLVTGLMSDAIRPSLGDESLRHALLLVPPLCIWASFHYFLAARTVDDDLRMLREERTAS
ncbi:MAG: spinster family MFS transporter [Bradyrhizobium sp.]